MWTWILIALVAVILLAAIGIYNSLVTLKARSEEAWSDISVQLKRRYDLIPNLVSSVKSYAKHEREVFEKVTKARADAMDAGTMKDKEKAENELSKTLKSIFAVAENYPQLRANENFLNLQEELTDTENKIEASRRFYNANVRDYNIKIRAFPSNVFANIFNFQEKQLFEVEPSQKEAVEKAPKVEI
jgi:LemA protein